MRKNVLLKLGKDTYNEALEEANNLIGDFIEQTRNSDGNYTDLKTIFICDHILLAENQDLKFIEAIESVFRSLLLFSNELLYAKNVDYISNLGMFVGVGNFSFSIWLFKRKRGSLKNMDEYYYQIIQRSIPQIVNDFENKKMDFILYDIIFGVSGLLNYMLERNDKESSNKLLNVLIEYSNPKEVNDCKTLGFHIERDQLIDPLDREYFVDGCLDLGMSHGIIGPAITMSKCFYENIGEKEMLLEAINRITEIYTQNARYEDSIIKFPTRIASYGETNKLKYHLSFNESWCYGNISIIWSLMKISRNLGRSKDYDYYLEELVKVCNLAFEDYNLDSSILCHGIAGVITIQLCAYDDTKDIRFLSSLKRNVTQLLNLHRTLNDKGDLNYKSWSSFLDGKGGVLLTLLNVLGDSNYYSKILMCN